VELAETEGTVYGYVRVIEFPVAVVMVPPTGRVDPVTVMVLEALRLLSLETRPESMPVKPTVVLLEAEVTVPLNLFMGLSPGK
jgi:hypothetical protein